MLTSPNKFGSSLGGFKPIAEEPITVNFRNGGINTSMNPTQLEEGEAVDAIDVRFTRAGIATGYGTSIFGSVYAGAALKQVKGIANYQIPSGTRFLMRMRPTEWDRWNGASWLTLTGTLSGTATDNYSVAVAEDLLVAANGVDRLKSWNGLDTTAIADLSADAPIARYITKVGNRLLAAVIKVGTTINYRQVNWSADGNIKDWTSGIAGAGSAVPPVEGGDDTPNWITGLSTIEGGALIYRQRTLQLASLTGVGSAPFRFTTLDYSHGTESPLSIAKGGLLTGDYYLGYDYMPYHFDGRAANPIGMPIYETLRDSIASLSSVIGGLDRNEQEYYLAFPDSSGFVSYAWVFNIREYTRSQRFVWRRRSLNANVTSLGYGFLVNSPDPVVDSVGGLVNDQNKIVDSYAITSGPDRMLFGTNLGAVNVSDQTIFPVNGIYTSKQFTFNGLEVTLDRVRLYYKATTAAQVTVSVSTDGGSTFLSPRVFDLLATGSGEANLSKDFMIVGREFQFRIAINSGYLVLSQMECTLQPRGRGNA